MDTDKVSSLEKLYKKTHAACGKNNIEEIQHILFSDCYPGLTQSEKETNIFIIANDLLETKELGQDVLKYLIFDYKIKENLPFKSFHTKEVNAMFESRNLNNELINELEDLNGTNKKLKI